MQMCIDELEITTHWEHDMICAEVIGNLCYKVDKVGSLPVSVEFSIVRIRNEDTFLAVIIIKVEVFRWIVGVVYHHEGEKLGSLAKVIE